MKNVLFIHIPKTGGTTVWNTLGIVKTRNAQRGDFTPVKTGWVSFGHGTLKDMLGLELVSPQFLESAYKFAFVRNPYDRAVSHWAFCCQTKKWGMDKNTTFLEYTEGVMQKISNHRPQSKLIEGPPRLDKLCKFETFEDDLKQVALEIGIVEGISIPHLNASERPHYSKVYCTATKQNVEDFYAQDFEQLGYNKEEWNECN